MPRDKLRRAFKYLPLKPLERRALANVVSSGKSVPQWFIHALRRYYVERSATFTKQQLRWFIRSVLGKNIADETVARYVRYAQEQGILECIANCSGKGKAIYLIKQVRK